MKFNLDPCFLIENRSQSFKVVEFTNFLNNYFHKLCIRASNENKTDIEELEKMKILYLLKVYESLTLLNRYYNNIMSTKTEICTYYKFFDKSILETDEFTCQIVILIVLLFYTLRIVSKKMAVV